MISGSEMTGMILTSCQTHAVQHFSVAVQSQSVCLAAPVAQTTSTLNVALRSLLRYGHQMVLGLSGSAQSSNETSPIPRLARTIKASQPPGGGG